MSAMIHSQTTITVDGDGGMQALRDGVSAAVRQHMERIAAEANAAGNAIVDFGVSHAAFTIDGQTRVLTTTFARSDPR